MDETIKKQWVEALRGGDYKQGRASLHVTGIDGMDRYCCLGVLSELAVEAGAIKRYSHVSDTNSSTMFYYGGEYPGDPAGSIGFLTLAVSEWAGLPATPTANTEVERGITCSVIANRTPISLDLLNDSGVTFAEIAELIEEQL